MREVELPPDARDGFFARANLAGLSLQQAEQMWECARQAVLQERERCAAICDRMRSVSAVSYETGSACAAAIRSQT